MLDVTASLTLPEVSESEQNKAVYEKGNDFDRLRHRGIKINIEKGALRQDS